MVGVEGQGHGRRQAVGIGAVDLVITVRTRHARIDLKRFAGQLAGVVPVQVQRLVLVGLVVVLVARIEAGRVACGVIDGVLAEAVAALVAVREIDLGADAVLVGDRVVDAAVAAQAVALALGDAVALRVGDDVAGRLVQAFLVAAGVDQAAVVAEVQAAGEAELAGRIRASEIAVVAAVVAGIDRDDAEAARTAVLLEDQVDDAAGAFGRILGARIVHHLDAVDVAGRHGLQRGGAVVALHHRRRLAVDIDLDVRIAAQGQVALVVDIDGRHVVQRVGGGAAGRVDVLGIVVDLAVDALGRLGGGDGDRRRALVRRRLARGGRRRRIGGLGWCGGLRRGGAGQQQGGQHAQAGGRTDGAMAVRHFRQAPLETRAGTGAPRAVVSG